MKTNAINDNLNELSEKISGESGIKPRSQVRTRTRGVFGVAILLLGILGVALWKFAPPVVREVKLDLKNGYTLAMQIPVDWTVDEKATSSFNSNFFISNPELKEKYFYIQFKRSQPTGVRLWIESALYRDSNLYGPCDIKVECEIHPMKGAYDPREKRNQDMMQFQSIFGAIERTNQKVKIGQTDTVFTKNDTLAIGYGFEARTQPKLKGKQKIGPATLFWMSDKDETSIYSVTPDMMQTVSIKIIANFPVEKERVAMPAKHLLASSMKFVQTNSNVKRTNGR